MIIKRLRILVLREKEANKMTKPIDLIELRKQIKEGIFNVYLHRKKVYIEDAENGESVMIYDLKAGERE